MRAEGDAGWADSTRTMALALAVLFLAGAATGALTLILPHPAAADTPMLWTNVGLAVVAAVLLFALADRLPRWSLYAVVAAGTIIVTRAVYLSHEAGTFYTFWYIWVGLYAFFFFGRRWGVAQVALVGACYAWALTQGEQSSPVARWVMTIGTLLIGGMLVDVLAGRLRGALRTSRESEEKMRSVVESANEAFISIDRAGLVTDWNPSAERTFGWRREETIGRPVAELIIPGPMREQHRRGIKHFLDTGEGPVLGKRIELIAVHQDGHEFPVELAISPVEADGQWSFHALLHDITKRREEEEAVRRLAAIVESSDEAIIGITLGARVTSWNRGAERLYGFTAEEMLGSEMAELVPEDRWEEIGDILGRLSIGGVVQMDTQRVAKGGELLDVSVTYSPLVDAAGRVTGAAVIARDIGGRKRREAYAAAQHAATRVLADVSTVEEAPPRLLPILVEQTGWTCGAWWVPEKDGTVLTCDAIAIARSDQLDQVTPFFEGDRFAPAEEFDGAPERLREAIWSRDRREGPALPGAEAAAKIGLRCALWLPVVSRGRLLGAFFLLGRETRERDAELVGILVSLAADFASLIDRRRAEEEAERVKNEFLGLVSHELRTPLTSIVGYTELLLDSEGDSLTERQRDFIEVVRRNAEREVRLVGDLLLLVRIEAGTFTIEPQIVSLEEIVTQSVEAARPRAAAQGIDLGLHTATVAPTMADPHRISQIVDNLLSNAIKFTPEGGSVDVRLSSADGEAVIEVADSGIGIPPDEQARLFDRLFRASSATAMHIPGIGVGLTIVKALVESHRGKVAVESTEGEGTTFRVELPLSAPAPGTARRRAPVA